MSEQKALIGTRNPPSGSFYKLKIGGKVIIGEDAWYNPANAWMQYVRLYLNYFPNSEEEMINLAIMNTGNIFMMQI